MTDNSTNRSPHEIERDIRATQDDMSRTVEQLGDELTGGNLFKSLLDKAGESGLDVRSMIDAAQRNPLALALIAVGGLWLMSPADAKPSALTPSKGQSGTFNGQQQAHGADKAQGFDRAKDTASDLAHQSRERAQQAISQVQGFYSDNPLISGLAAAFAGAIAGSAIPATRTEANYVGTMGEDMIGTAQTKLKQTGEEARKLAGSLADKVEQKLNGTAGEKAPSGSAQTA